MAAAAFRAEEEERAKLYVGYPAAAVSTLRGKDPSPGPLSNLHIHHRAGPGPGIPARQLEPTLMHADIHKKEDTSQSRWYILPTSSASASECTDGSMFWTFSACACVKFDYATTSNASATTTTSDPFPPTAPLFPFYPSFFLLPSSSFLLPPPTSNHPKHRCWYFANGEEAFYLKKKKGKKERKKELYIDYVIFIVIEENTNVCVDHYWL